MNRVIFVEPRDNHVLFVRLANGKEGEFDASPYLDKGIFVELNDPSYFKQARLAFGGVVWPHEQDFSADTIEIEMKELASAPAAPQPPPISDYETREPGRRDRS